MSFLDGPSDEEANLTVRELLTEMKDISEVIVDLAYASLLFDSQEIGAEVKHLESIMDGLNREIRVRAVLAGRTKEEAVQLSSLLQVAEASASISRAASDLADALDLESPRNPFLSFVLRDAEEKILMVSLSPASDMRGRTIESLSVESETGMRVIAIKRGIRWIYDPEPEEALKESDMLVVRGTEDGFKRLSRFARGEEPWPSYPTEE